MATILPPPMQDPLVTGLQQLAAGIGQGMRQRQQQQKINQDMQNLRNMLDPERNELDAQRRFAQGLPLLEGQTSRHTGEAGTQQMQFQTPQGQALMMQILGQRHLANILNPAQKQAMQQSAAMHPGALAGQQQGLAQGQQALTQGAEAFPGQQANLAARTAATRQATKQGRESHRTEQQYLKQRTKAIKQQTQEWKADLDKGGTRGDAVVADIAATTKRLAQNAEQMQDARLSNAARTLDATAGYHSDAIKQILALDPLDYTDADLAKFQDQMQYHREELAKLLPEIKRIGTIQANKAGTNPSSDPLGLGL